MIFEVQIPAADGSGLVSTFQIQASSWRSALQAGLAETGSEQVPLEGAHVQLDGDVVRFTDPVARRLITLTQIDEANARQSKLIQSMTGRFKPVKPEAAAAPEPAAPAPAPEASEASKKVKLENSSASVGGAGGLGFKDRSTGQFRPIGTSEIKRKAQVTGEGEAVVLQETHAPAPVKSADEPAAASEDASISDTALEDVFLEIMAIFEPDYALEDAIDFVLDLASRSVPSAAGGVMFASDQADHLYFAAAKGEGRKQLLKGQFDIAKGVPAVALREGVALALSDPSGDPRYTNELAEAAGVDVRSICCAPIQHGARAFGVMVLLNRKERGFYSQYDSNILSYIGGQMGKFIQEQLDAAPLE